VKTGILDVKTTSLLSTPGTFATSQEPVAREAYPAFFAPVVPFGREAVRIHGWELGAVPGLLQTEDYIRSLIRSGHPMDNGDEIDRFVAARLERQEIVTSPAPPLLWYVLDESVLRHVAGGAAVMRHQQDRLLDAAEVSGIVAQILPFAAGNHAGPDGPISVYDFASSPSVSYTECYSGGRTVEGREEVADLMTVINLIRASALSARESRQPIRGIRREIDA